MLNYQHKTSMSDDQYDICVVGGAGHVGLPLSLVFAEQGYRVCIFDKDREKLAKIKSGRMPFLEQGADQLLEAAIDKTLFVSDKPGSISQSKFVVVIIGTPVDEHLNPEFGLMKKTFEKYLPYFQDGQIVILRSTVFPGTTEKVQDIFKQQNKDVAVCFCPERLAEGKAIKELKTLPQIVSGFDKLAVAKIAELFKKIGEESIFLTPLEAELSKLFSNTWRYIKFAVTNQFYMVAQDKGADFYRIYKAMTYKYPRAQDLPKAGFAAGPCLLKDTMQLNAFNQNNFPLGTAAMFINEGLPNFIVERLKKQYNLKEKKVGVLGMAFKADSDDKRESLAYKLRKILEIEAKKVLCADVYIKEEGFVSADQLVENSDIIILAAPHKQYKDLSIPQNKTLIDIWDFYGQ